MIKMITAKMTSSRQRIVRASFLALLMVSFVGCTVARARRINLRLLLLLGAEADERFRAETSAGPARQLVHESKEAAGEEKDEMAGVQAVGLGAAGSRGLRD